MISVAPTPTEAGKNLLMRALLGEKITFTRFKIGNGELANDSDPANLTDLLNPLVEFPIIEYDSSSKGHVKISGKFDNTYITSDFAWTELGIYCKGEDDVEVLYAYSNDGENAGRLKANATDIVIEQTISIIIAIGEAENVTAILSESLLYASKEEFETHINNKKNPHGTDAEDVGLGKVPNVATNDQTPTYEVATEDKALESGEKLSVAFGKLARVVNSVISHLKNKENPHGLTCKKLGAAASKHTHSAADISSAALGIARGGTGGTSAAAARYNLGALTGKRTFYEFGLLAGEFYKEIPYEFDRDYLYSTVKIVQSLTSTDGGRSWVSCPVIVQCDIDEKKIWFMRPQGIAEDFPIIGSYEVIEIY